MADLIDRQAALDTFGLSDKTRKYGGDHSGYDTIMLYEVQDAIEALPSVNPQKVGRWIERGLGYDCSECNIGTSISCVKAGLMKYCPNCGAKMESEDKE